MLPSPPRFQALPTSPNHVAARAEAQTRDLADALGRNASAVVLTELDDDAVVTLCGHLEPNLRLAPSRRSQTPGSVTAWALCNQALIQLQYSWSADLLDRSEALLTRAGASDLTLVGGDTTRGPLTVVLFAHGQLT